MQPHGPDLSFELTILHFLIRTLLDDTRKSSSLENVSDKAINNVVL